MKLYIYSDGSTHANKGFATSILFTDTTYIGMAIRDYTVRIPSETEFHGVIQAMCLFQGRISKYKNIDIYTDDESIVVQFNKIKKSRYHVPINISCRTMWLEFIKLCRGHTVNMYFIKGHQIKSNPNKVCDKLSKLSSRFNIRK